MSCNKALYDIMSETLQIQSFETKLLVIIRVKLYFSSIGRIGVFNKIYAFVPILQVGSGLVYRT